MARCERLARLQQQKCRLHRSEQSSRVGNCTWWLPRLAAGLAACSWPEQIPVVKRRLTAARHRATIQADLYWATRGLSAAGGSA